MSIVDKLAYFQRRRDEVPNQELAEELAARRDHAGIREIAERLDDPNAQIQSDCLKVLYEIGYRDPALIAEYAPAFVNLLSSRNNRLVWGSMIALSTIATIKADALYQQIPAIKQAIEHGSVITVDNGIKTLARIASSDPGYNREFFPYLLRHLETCRPKDVPQHAEHVVAAVNADNQRAFIAVVEQRSVGMPASRMTRLRKVLREADQLQKSLE
jgi:hypothetical protein